MTELEELKIRAESILGALTLQRAQAMDEAINRSADLAVALAKIAELAAAAKTDDGTLNLTEAEIVHEP